MSVAVHPLNRYYTAAGVLWHGHWQAVRFNAPLDVVARLLAAAEDAERQENAARGEDNSQWFSENLFGLAFVKNPDTLPAKALPPGN